jgi:hypothetical protein
VPSDTFAREEEQFDRQFLAQAQECLNPEQLAAFEKHPQRQRQPQIAQSEFNTRIFMPFFCLELVLTTAIQAPCCSVRITRMAMSLSSQDFSKGATTGIVDNV